MDSARLALIDLQTRILNTIPEADRLTERALFLAEAALLFEVPVLTSAQAPEKLGGWIPQAWDRIPDLPLPHSKTRFSAAQIFLEEVEPDTLFIVAGIETHICIRRTVLELLNANHPVYVAADAVAARGSLDHELALREMERAGAMITTSEAIAYHWCEDSQAAQFRALSQLVRRYPQTVSARPETTDKA